MFLVGRVCCELFQNDRHAPKLELSSDSEAERLPLWARHRCLPSPFTLSVHLHHVFLISCCDVCNTAKKQMEGENAGMCPTPAIAALLPPYNTTAFRFAAWTADLNTYTNKAGQGLDTSRETFTCDDQCPHRRTAPTSACEDGYIDTIAAPGELPA